MAVLDILFPNGQALAAQVYIDPGTGPEKWTGSISVAPPVSSAAVTTQVPDNASNVTLLASNSSRTGATIENSSSATLYVKLGTTATTSDYTVKIVQNAYYEVPFGYIGRIDGIWATDPGNGSAHITELT